MSPGAGRLGDSLTSCDPMNGYTKLFHSILASSVWSEDDQTRIVWITLLAMADQHGEIQASIPGVARLAGVSLQATEAAIAKFLGPDPYSRTPDNEGRRLLPMTGGWVVSNHAKYRLMASKEDEKRKTAERVARHREAKRYTPLHTVTGQEKPLQKEAGNGQVTEERDIAKEEAEAETKEKNKPQGAPPLSLPIEDPPHPFQIAFGLVLPENLQTLPCLEAVRTWLQYKQERRQGYKPTGLRATLTKWANEFTSATLPAAIENSMACNYSGVFPPNQPQKPSPKPKRDLAAMTEEEKKAILREAMR